MKNKKKLIVIVLLLLLAVGITGFGVYSYYWAQGTVTTENNYATISLTRQFYPKTDANGSSYLGSGGSISLNCPTPEDGDTSVTCTGSLVVENDSTESISLSIVDDSVSTYSGSEKVSLGEPSIYCPSDYISPNGTATVTFSVVATLGTGNVPEEVSEPVTGEEVNVSIDFDLKATQYHSGY